MTQIDEKERKDIEIGAKKILDNFASALGKVKATKAKKTKKEVGGFREENNFEVGNEEFRKIMFLNAPKKAGDSILAETKEW